MSRTNVLQQMGQFCTTHLCKTCPIMGMAKKHHHGCPECLRVPEIAEAASRIIQREKTMKKEEWT